MSLLADKCNKLNINLILCIPISLYKPINTIAEIKKIDNYNYKDKILDVIACDKDILMVVSNKYDHIYHLDISNNIESDISLFDDKYHTVEKGNKIVVDEIKYFIVRKQLISM